MKAERLIWLGALAASGVLLQQCDARANRDIGALNARIGQLSALHRVLQQKAESLESDLRVDTVHLTRVLTRRDTVLDSIIRHDTIPLTRRETVLVAIADTAIRACTEALGTCAALVRVKDSLLTNYDERLRVEIARRPSFLDKARSAVVYGAAGFLLAKVVR